MITLTRASDHMAFKQNGIQLGVENRQKAAKNSLRRKTIAS